MTATVPATRPELSRDDVVARANAAGVDTSKPFVYAERGYYRDSVGAVGANDIDTYDDAVFYCSPTLFLPANANTDPSAERPNMASLESGVWTFGRVVHNQSKDPAVHPHYPAYGQACDVVVHRFATDAVAPGTKDDRGRCLGAGRWVGSFAIHLHKGSHSTTSSEGCQTIPPEQWDDFYDRVNADLRGHGVETFPYILTARASA